MEKNTLITFRVYVLRLSRSAKDYETAVETWELSMAAGDPEMAQTTTPVF